LTWMTPSSSSSCYIFSCALHLSDANQAWLLGMDGAFSANPYSSFTTAWSIGTKRLPALHYSLLASMSHHEPRDMFFQYLLFSQSIMIDNTCINNMLCNTKSSWLTNFSTPKAPNLSTHINNSLHIEQNMTHLNLISQKQFSWLTNY
jgi:hypothetical protein